MSVEAMALVLHHSRAQGTSKLVLLGIANHEGDGGAWPTVATLARYANVTERQVQTCIAKLVKLGELAVHRQGGGTRDMRADERPNLYRVQVACPWNCDHTTNHRPRKLGTDLDHRLPMPVDNGVKHTSPGEAQFTPRGEARFTQTIHPTNTHQAAGQLQTARASRGGPLCTLCNRPASVCCKPIIQLDYPHDFTPPGREA